MTSRKEYETELAGRIVGALDNEWLATRDIAENLGAKEFDVHFMLSRRTALLNRYVPDGYEIQCRSNMGLSWRLWPKPRRFTIEEAQNTIMGILADREWHLQDELIGEVVGPAYEPSAGSDAVFKAEKSLFRLKGKHKLAEKEICTSASEGPRFITFWRWEA